MLENNQPKITSDLSTIVPILTSSPYYTRTRA